MSFVLVEAVSTALCRTWEPSSCWPSKAEMSQWSLPWWTTETSPSTPSKTSSCPPTCSPEISHRTKMGPGLSHESTSVGLTNKNKNISEEACPFFLIRQRWAQISSTPHTEGSLQGFSAQAVLDLLTCRLVLIFIRSGKMLKTSWYI